MSMPALPTISEIRARVISDIETKIGQTTPFLSKAFNKVLAGAIAGIVILLYRFGSWVYAQIFPKTADRESLILLGTLVGISPTSANASTITADVYGDDGATVSEGTLFKSDTSIIYSVTIGGTISDTSVNCTLVSQSTGDETNIADGEELSIVTTDSNLTGTAIVTGTTTEGDDEETTEAFRIRVISKYKKRYTGGSPADYEGWGLEAPHFIWVSPVAGDEPGEVYVYGMVDNTDDGIPTSAQLETLLSYVECDPDSGVANRRPIGDEVSCLAISRKTFSVNISIQDATEDAKTDIEAAISDYMDEVEPYNEGVSLERNDAVTDAGVTAAAVETAKGYNATILALSVTEDDTGDAITSCKVYGGERPQLSTINWTTIS